jgi:hypothetical protein
VKSGEVTLILPTDAVAVSLMENLKVPVSLHVAL